MIGVANGLVHNPVPLGILPLGAGNALARALLIPLNLDEAIGRLVNDHTVMEIDARQVGGGTPERWMAGPIDPRG